VEEKKGNCKIEVLTGEGVDEEDLQEMIKFRTGRGGTLSPVLSGSNQKDRCVKPQLGGIDRNVKQDVESKKPIINKERGKNERVPRKLWVEGNKKGSRRKGKKKGRGEMATTEEPQVGRQ